MPMNVNEVKKYEEYEQMEITISGFLEANKGKAYTYIEIYNGLGMSLMKFEPNDEGSNWTLANAGRLIGSTLILNNFHDKLLKMSASGKINMRVVNGAEYYFIE